MLKLGVIGCGNMAAATLKGIAAGYRGEHALFGYDISREKTAALAEIGLKAEDTIADVMRDAEYVLLSVKPQNMSDILAEIAACPEKDRVFLSIAAGIPAERIKRELGYDAKVVPIMPNTPLLVGMGATAMARVAPVSEEEFAVAQEIFRCAGVVRKLPPTRCARLSPSTAAVRRLFMNLPKDFWTTPSRRASTGRRRWLYSPSPCGALRTCWTIPATRWTS